MRSVVLAKVGSLWEVLAKQAVGVLVGATLPGFRGVAEVDLKTGRNLDLEGVAHLPTLVPGHRLQDELGKLVGCSDDGVPDLLRTVAIGQVQEQHEAG